MWFLANPKKANKGSHKGESVINKESTKNQQRTPAFLFPVAGRIQPTQR
jgi:hypothetical protein